MPTMQELLAAIEQLPKSEREKILHWLNAPVFGADRVEEPSAAYAAESEPQVTVEDYLRLELASSERHEFIHGQVFAMAGASEAHELIAGNLFAALHSHLRGGPCRVYGSNFKLRITQDLGDVFYYPDGMVSCTREGIDTYFLRFPTLLAEVLSPSTASIDVREKLLSYTQIPSLSEYLILSQSEPRATLYRRTAGWAPQRALGLTARVELQSVALTVTLEQLYGGGLNAVT